MQHRINMVLQCYQLNIIWHKATSIEHQIQLSDKDLLADLVTHYIKRDAHLLTEKPIIKFKRHHLMEILFFSGQTATEFFHHHQQQHIYVFLICLPIFFNTIHPRKTHTTHTYTHTHTHISVVIKYPSLSFPYVILQREKTIYSEHHIHWPLASEISDVLLIVLSIVINLSFFHLLLCWLFPPFA